MPCKALTRMYQEDQPSKDDQFSIDKAGQPSKSFDRHARESKFLIAGAWKSVASAHKLANAHDRRVKAGKATPAMALSEVVAKLEDEMLQKAAS